MWGTAGQHCAGGWRAPEATAPRPLHPPQEQADSEEPLFIVLNSEPGWEHICPLEHSRAFQELNRCGEKPQFTSFSHKGACGAAG